MRSLTKLNKAIDAASQIAYHALYQGGGLYSFLPVGIDLDDIAEFHIKRLASLENRDVAPLIHADWPVNFADRCAACDERLERS